MSYTAIAPLAKPPTATMKTEMPSKVAKPPRKSSKPSSKAGQKSDGKPSGVSKSCDKTHRRSRSGCFTCRLRRKKCDEGQPVCKACRNLKLDCEYNRPMWWSNNDQRRNHKDLLKTLIKNTKMHEKANRAALRTDTPPSLSHSVPTPDTYTDVMDHTRAASVESHYSLEYETEKFPQQDHQYDPFSAQLQTPHFDSTAFYGQMAPYEVDIKTESQIYVNDVPTRRDSSISTFSTFQPPMSHVTLPTFAGEDWINPEYFGEAKETFGSPEDTQHYNTFGFSHAPVHAPMILVDECDRRLLDHFLENVLRLIFPILEARQQGTVRSDVILPALETNKGYLHCCLSIAAVHLKATEGINGEQIDNDILKHRYESVSELCKALNRDTDHLQILEATLGMVFFQCSVGRPDDALPDIPWHQHFQAATSLVHKLDLPNVLMESENTHAHPPFNMTLAAWIDILGSTMLGKTPQFAHTYRTRHLSGSSSGLCELMGCEDRVMYLISEISCLEALKLEGRIDDLALCSHVTALAAQLDHTEAGRGSLIQPYTEAGSLMVPQLCKNMTSLYRVAARVYLCSLVPGFDRNQPSTVNLIAHFAEFLDLIPSGPDGFDRSLVWPYLICGSYSTPNSHFRAVFSRRIELLGEQASFGSFGRMVHLLQEVWRIADSTYMADPALLAGPSGKEEPSSLPTPVSGNATPGGVKVPGANGGQQPKAHHVHWRDVMQQNRWEYLLI